MSGFKSSVTDYAEIRERWREIGSTLPTGTESEVDITPKPGREPAPEPGHYDYGCGGTYVSHLSFMIERELDLLVRRGLLPPLPTEIQAFIRPPK